VIEDLRAGFEQGCRRRSSINEQAARELNADIVAQFKRMQVAENALSQDDVIKQFFH
jgi:hypothetical protein